MIRFHVFTTPLSVSALCLPLLACGSDPNANVSAELSWAFDYSAYTEAAPTADVRDCSNQPSSNPGPAYEAVEVVRVVFEDPEGLSANFDQELPCERGNGSNQAAVRGLAAIPYRLILEGKSAAGAVLYRYIAPEEIDLANKFTADLLLPTLTGELTLAVGYEQVEHSYACNDAVDSLRITVFRKKDGVTDTDHAVLSQLVDECDDGFVRSLFIRNIPTEPELAAGGGYVLPLYTVQVEALDGSAAPLHCGHADRGVKPGSGLNIGGTIFLSPGPCTL